MSVADLSFNTYIDEAGKKISDKKGVREFLLEAKAGRGEVKETISADTLPSKAAAVINPVPKIKTEVTKEVKEAVNLPVPEDPNLLLILRSLSIRQWSFSIWLIRLAAM